MRRLIVGFGLLLLSRSAIAEVSAQGFIDGLLSEYRTMRPGKAEEISPEDRSHNERVRKSLLDRLDVDKLGRLSLADHWDRLQPAQREEFLSVLRTVLEERSIKNLKATRERFEVQYDGVDAFENGEALVKTILQLKNEEYFVDFRLEPRGDSWVIYDVVTDDVSTIRNYRDQFNKIIAEKGFDELLRRMRENLIEDPGKRSTAEPGAG
jgi:phospholipid transport system substrate-binding protein